MSNGLYQTNGIYQRRQPRKCDCDDCTPNPLATVTVAETWPRGTGFDLQVIISEGCGSIGPVPASSTSLFWPSYANANEFLLGWVAGQDPLLQPAFSVAGNVLTLNGDTAYDAVLAAYGEEAAAGFRVAFCSGICLSFTYDEGDSPPDPSVFDGQYAIGQPTCCDDPTPPPAPCDYAFTGPIAQDVPSNTPGVFIDMPFTVFPQPCCTEPFSFLLLTESGAATTPPPDWTLELFIVDATNVFVRVTIPPGPHVGTYVYYVAIAGCNADLNIKLASGTINIVPAACGFTHDPLPPFGVHDTTPDGTTFYVGVPIDPIDVFPDPCCTEPVVLTVTPRPGATEPPASWTATPVLLAPNQWQIQVTVNDASLYPGGTLFQYDCVFGGCTLPPVSLATTLDITILDL